MFIASKRNFHIVKETSKLAISEKTQIFILEEIHNNVVLIIIIIITFTSMHHISLKQGNTDIDSSIARTAHQK